VEHNRRVADTSRIDELKRRVEKDPASIAFAQLAEEYRRAGQYEDAVRVSRAGLAQHPAYLSARVTLGRALTDLKRYDEAQAELEYVLRAAPDNLSAIRAVADLHQRRGELTASLQRFSDAIDAARNDRPTAKPSARAVDDIPLPPEPDAALFQQALASLDALTLDVPPPSLEAVNAFNPDALDAARDPVLTDLEAWLDAILLDRERRILRS
jgi:tetratricopeptide (TPR) repeat protein